MTAFNHKGFSLVEILVAAAVISLSLFATVIMVRKGQEMINLDKHRRMARGIIERTLENDDYQPANYNGLTTITAPTPKDTVIDPGANIHGSLSVYVGAEQPTINGAAIPYRIITAAITWAEVGSTSNETVSISKWIAYIPAKK